MAQMKSARVSLLPRAPAFLPWPPGCLDTTLSCHGIIGVGVLIANLRGWIGGRLGQFHLDRLSRVVGRRGGGMLHKSRDTQKRSGLQPETKIISQLQGAQGRREAYWRRGSSAVHNETCLPRPASTSSRTLNCKGQMDLIQMHLLGSIRQSHLSSPPLPLLPQTSCREWKLRGFISCSIASGEFARPAEISMTMHRLCIEAPAASPSLASSPSQLATLLVGGHPNLWPLPSHGWCCLDLSWGSHRQFARLRHLEGEMIVAWHLQG